jgi:integrase
LGNIDLFNRSIMVRRNTTKTDAGSRSIPLNDTALWAVARLLDRAEVLGASDPEHYLLPGFLYRRTRQPTPVGSLGNDPTRPMKTCRTAWRSLRKAAGLPTLRFHDLRHTCITKLAEAGVPDHVLMSISGHISPEMIKHYAHIRSKAKEAAVAAMRSYSPPEANAQNVVPIRDAG